MDNSSKVFRPGANERTIHDFKSRKTRGDEIGWGRLRTPITPPIHHQFSSSQRQSPFYTSNKRWKRRVEVCKRIDGADFGTRTTSNPHNSTNPPPFILISISKTITPLQQSMVAFRRGFEQVEYFSPWLGFAGWIDLRLLKTATPQVPPPIPIQSYRLVTTYLIHHNSIQQLGRKKRTWRVAFGDRSLGVPNAQSPPFPPSTIYRTDHKTLEVTDLRSRTLWRENRGGFDLGVGVRASIPAHKPVNFGHLSWPPNGVTRLQTESQGRRPEHSAGV